MVLNVLNSKHKGNLIFFFQLILNADITAFLVTQVGKAAKLDKFEIPAKIRLLPEPWTPESGLVTAALKIKREQLKAMFKDELQKLYA